MEEGASRQMKKQEKKRQKCRNQSLAEVDGQVSFQD